MPRQSVPLCLFYEDGPVVIIRLLLWDERSNDTGLRPLCVPTGIPGISRFTNTPARPLLAFVHCASYIPIDQFLVMYVCPFPFDPRDAFRASRGAACACD